MGSVLGPFCFQFIKNLSGYCSKEDWIAIFAEHTSIIEADKRNETHMNPDLQGATFLLLIKQTHSYNLNMKVWNFWFAKKLI